jgi:hypothetical protein
MTRENLRGAELLLTTRSRRRRGATTATNRETFTARSRRSCRRDRRGYVGRGCRTPVQDVLLSWAGADCFSALSVGKRRPADLVADQPTLWVGIKVLSSAGLPPTLDPKGCQLKARPGGHLGSRPILVELRHPTRPPG